MTQALKYCIVLLLSVGLLFLTTDIESCFIDVDNQAISQVLDSESQGETENTHSLHHLSEDLFSAINSSNYNYNGISLGKIVLLHPRINNNFLSSIWQPPKFS